MKYDGDCFIKNGHDFMDLKSKDAVIVHGIVTNTKTYKPMSHCWIEDEEAEMVIDVSNGNDNIIPSQLYYAIGNVTEVKKYSKKEYYKKLMEFEHWGPWELNEDNYE